MMQRYFGGKAVYLRVDEVSPVLVECIQDLKGGFLVAFAESFFPNHQLSFIPLHCLSILVISDVLTTPCRNSSPPDTKGSP